MKREIQIPDSAQRKKSMGFTLVELMVAVAISGIALAALTALFISTNEMYTVQNKVTDIQQGSRGAMQLMTRDIRMAGVNSSTFPGMALANSTELRIGYDCSASNLGSCDKNRNYRYDSGDKALREGSNNLLGGPDTDVAVTSSSFSYTMANGAVLSNPSDPSAVRQVRINFCGKIRGSYSDTYDEEYCFNSTAKCRNMGLGD